MSVLSLVLAFFSYFSPLSSSLTTKMSQPPDRSDTNKCKCVHLTNNCLYFIKFHSDSGLPDSIVDIVKSSFTVEEIKIAFTTIRDWLPESSRQERHAKHVSVDKQIQEISHRLKTTMDIHIFPEDPYKLPPAKPGDLNLNSVHNVALKAIKDAQAIPDLTNGLAEIKSQIDKLFNQQEFIIDNITKLKESTELSESPPSDEVPDTLHHSPTAPQNASNTSEEEVTQWEQPTPTAPSPSMAIPLHLAPTVPLGTSNTSDEEGTNGGQPTPTSPSPSLPSPPVGASYSQALQTDTQEEGIGEWQEVRRRRKDRPIRNIDTTQINQRNFPARRRFEKRCHIVIHHLHSSVTLEAIEQRVKELTGSVPLIIHELPCYLDDQVAYRVSCLFQHLDVLKGENFGESVSVSFYDLRRDHRHPYPSPPGTLTPLQSLQNTSPSTNRDLASPTPHGIPNFLKRARNNPSQNSWNN